MHQFDIMVNGEVVTFTRFEDIPKVFEHVIAFVPEIPPPPHSDSDHEEIEQWNVKFKQLMEIEYASSSKSR